MEDFSLKTYLIPELLENKIDFRILNYKNGDPVQLMVLYAYHGFWYPICRVDIRSVIGSTDCYNVVWHSKTPSFISTGYARAHDLVRDIRREIDLNFKGEDKMNNKIYHISDIEFNSSRMDEINITVNVMRPCAIREDVDRIREAIESIGKTPVCVNNYKFDNRCIQVTWRRDKFDIKDVIFNNPATIVLWADGTKTVVKAENEEFDPEKGLAMAIAKKVLGNNYGYYDIFKKYVGRYEKKQKNGDK